MVSWFRRMKIQMFVANKNTGADTTANKLRMIFANTAIHFYKIYSLNVAVYEGEFKNDKREGKGIFKFPDGGVYEAEFLNGLFQGKEIYKYVNGDVYEGEFKNGLFEGKEFINSRWGCL